jgi:hypothetical protein
MTKRNSQDWWQVAKIYLYERWDKAQEEFKPLIRHLGFKYPIQLSSKTPYETADHFLQRTSWTFSVAERCLVSL